MSKPTWVTTLGQLRAATAGLPDDTSLFADEGDGAVEDHGGRFFEVSVGYVFPATSTQHPALILALGQCWDSEYELQQRLDDYIDYAPEPVQDFLDELDALPDGEEPNKID
jgi:hypothetical protein